MHKVFTIHFYWKLMAVLGFCFGYRPAVAEGETDVTHYPPSFGMGIEMGQVWSGVNNDKSAAANARTDIDRDFVQRTGVGITERVVVNNVLDLKLGVGGLFWYAYPPDEGDSPWDNMIRFGPGITEASAKYNFGNEEDAATYLKLGFFPVKYNHDADNLGEYLFRSIPYPNLVLTGGWAIVNSAAYMGQGILFHTEHLEGMITHDLTLFMERDFPPLYDFTPTYLLGLNFGILELGTGVSWHHAFVSKPSRLVSKRELATVVEFETAPDFRYYQRDSLSPQEIADLTLKGFGTKGTVTGFTELRDEKAFQDVNRTRDPKKINPYYRKIWVNGAGIRLTPADSGWDDSTFTETAEYEFPRTETRITARGIMLMGKAALNFGKLNDNLTGLRIFMELAVLGLENQPYFYEDLMERIPVMFGISVPTFQILDRLSFQAEYYKNSFEPHIYDLVDGAGAVWHLDMNDHRTYAPAHRDDWKWSVYLNRKIINGFKVSGQIANDHLRLINKNWLLSNIPVAINPSHWYYMIKFEFGV